MSDHWNVNLYFHPEECDVLTSLAEITSMETPGRIELIVPGGGRLLGRRGRSIVLPWREDNGVSRLDLRGPRGAESPLRADLVLLDLRMSFSSDDALADPSAPVWLEEKTGRLWLSTWTYVHFTDRYIRIYVSTATKGQSRLLRDSASIHRTFSALLGRHRGRLGFVHYEGGPRGGEIPLFVFWAHGRPMLEPFEDDDPYRDALGWRVEEILRRVEPDAQ